ncbi:MAG: hypothetical protein SFY95_12610 [Planctomycetota bacterium]|nr:hypothetical protein [Planctomycetota bacterium]
MACPCIGKALLPLLAVVGVGAAGFGGYNYMTTGCVLGKGEAALVPAALPAGAKDAAHKGDCCPLGEASADVMTVKADAPAAKKEGCCGGSGQRADGGECCGGCTDTKTECTDKAATACTDKAAECTDKAATACTDKKAECEGKSECGETKVAETSPAPAKQPS